MPSQPYFISSHLECSSKSLTWVCGKGLYVVRDVFEMTGMWKCLWQAELYKPPLPWFVATVYNMVSVLWAGGVWYGTQSMPPYSAPVSVFTLSVRCFHFDLAFSLWLVLSCTPLSSSLFPSVSLTTVQVELADVWSALDLTHLLLINTLSYWVGQAHSGWLIQKFISYIKQPELYCIWPALGEPAKQWLSQMCSHLLSVSLSTASWHGNGDGFRVFYHSHILLVLFLFTD